MEQFCWDLETNSYFLNLQNHYFLTKKNALLKHKQLKILCLLKCFSYCAENFDLNLLKMKIFGSILFLKR